MLKKREKVLNKVNSCILQYLNYSVSVSTAVSRNDQHSYLLTAPSSLDSSASFSLLFRILCFRFFPILYVCVLPASSTLIELEQDNWIRKKQQLTLVICTVNPAMILFNFLIIKYKTFNCHMISCSCYEYIICLPNADGWGEEGILEGACQWISVFLAVLLCWWPGGGFHSLWGSLLWVGLTRPFTILCMYCHDTCHWAKERPALRRPRSTSSNICEDKQGQCLH